MQVYNIGPVVLNFEREGLFVPVELTFSFSVAFHYLVPQSAEESERFHRNTMRLIQFFQGLNRAFVLESEYEETEIFTTGRVANVSIEVPNKFNKIPLFGALMYHKAEALLEEIALEEFRMTFELCQGGGDRHGELKSELLYNDMTYLGSNLETMIQVHEKEWMTEIVQTYLDVEDIDDLSDEERAEYLPWWKRPTGEVRDMVNINIYEIEDEDTGESLEGVPVRTKEEIMAHIVIPSIQLYDDGSDVPTSPSTPPTPSDDDASPDDNSYLKF